jgi:hypothetical protein
VVCAAGWDADPWHHRGAAGGDVTELEAACLLPVPEPSDVPVFTRVKVHRDYHVEVARALYSVPEHLIGTYLDARADRELVRFHSGGKLVKTHPRQPTGGRSTDPGDLPEHKAGMRCAT